MTRSELEYQIGEAKAEVDLAKHHHLGVTDPVGMDQLISKFNYLEQQLEDGDFEEDE